MAEQIRIGLAGCGGIMHRHVSDIEGQPGAEVVALMDTEPANIAKHKARHPFLADVAEYGDYDRMLAEADLTGVILASPHTVHYEQIMKALDAGVHVLCEKPMVCRIDHAGDVLKRVRETGLVLALAYQRHYGGTYRYIRDRIAAGVIGQVQTVMCVQYQGWKEATKDTWRQVPELSGGGQLNDSGSHLVDIMLWMTGLAAETVSAQIDDCGTPVDINSAVSVRFTNGAIGTLTVVGDYPGPGMWEDISIMGTKGGFHIRKGQPLVEMAGRDAPVYTVDAERLGGGSMCLNFLASIRGDETPAAPPECGLRVIELTEAAWESGRQGGVPVRVPRTDL